MRKPTIHWLCDRRGWAFDVIARVTAKNQPQYNHIFHYMKSANIKALKSVPMNDIIVCMFPPYLTIFNKLRNVVVCTSGIRALELTQNDKDTIYRELSELELESKDDGVAPFSTKKIRNSENASGFHAGCSRLSHSLF